MQTKLKNKKAYKIIAVLFMCMILSFCFSGCDQEQIESEDYFLSDYTATLNVSADNVVSITEEFTANYKKAMHGVIRTIPTKVVAYYEIDSKIVEKRYAMKISNARVLKGTCVSKGDENGGYYFKLGSNRLSPAGSSESFKISYDISIPDNRMSDYDTFYFNVIPHDWDVKITNVRYEINFEREFSKAELQDKTHIYVGKAGTQNIKGSFEFENSKISGTVDSLGAFEGVTVYTEFPKGTLGFSGSIYWIKGGICLGVLLLTLLLTLCYYKKSKFNRTLVPTVEFRAPDDLTPAECGLILDGKVDNRDLTSMIVYWASKGYLKIIDKDKNVSLQKLKDLDDTAKHYEKTVFNGIFGNETLINVKEIEFFGSTAVKAKNQLKVDLKHTNFENKSITARKTISFLSALISAIATYILLLSVAMPISLFPALLEFGLVLGACKLYAYAEDKKYFNSKFKTNTLKILSMLVPVLFLVGAFFAYEFYVDRFVLILWSHLASVLFMVLSAKVLSRTKISVERLGKIIGLKTYIETAEKDMLEMLVKETPTLFYDILPYAYVLNVTETYCKKFEKIKLTPPSWYVTDSLSNADMFTGYMIANKLNHSMASVNSFLISQATNVKITKAINTVGKISGGSIGGGTKGGGVSGGGLGGGGGRGW